MTDNNNKDTNSANVTTVSKTSKLKAKAKAKPKAKATAKTTPKVLKPRTSTVSKEKPLVNKNQTVIINTQAKPKSITKLKSRAKNKTAAKTKAIAKSTPTPKPTPKAKAKATPKPKLISKAKAQPKAKAIPTIKAKATPKSSPVTSKTTATTKTKPKANAQAKVKASTKPEVIAKTKPKKILKPRPKTKTEGSDVKNEKITIVAKNKIENVSQDNTIEKSENTKNLKATPKAKAKPKPKATPKAQAQPSKIKEEPKTKSTTPTEKQPEADNLPPKEKAEEQKPKFIIPEELKLNELRESSFEELYKIGDQIGINLGTGRAKTYMIFDIINYCVRRKCSVIAEGLIKISPSGIGYIYYTKDNFHDRIDDIYVSPSVIRKHQLEDCNHVVCKLKAPRGGEKYLAVDKVSHVEGIEADKWEKPKPFDSLTPMHPKDRLVLETDKTNVTARVIDLISPLGKGQRALIAAPPRGGKTVILKQIALSLRKNHPKSKLMIVLLDERPEEVTDFKDTVENVDIFASTFDEPPEQHVKVAEIVSARSKRLVEQGEEVIVLLDSLTRLARAHNLLLSNDGGASLSGGLSRNALDKPRRFFSSARNTVEKGSLTIIATALIETESRADEIIFEEFKGTGNMEIHIDRQLAERRIFPAIHISKTATRKDDLLYHPDEYQRITILRRHLSQLPANTAIKTLIKGISMTSSNAELLLSNMFD